MATEAEAARNEKDDACAVEAETWERERIAKCRVKNLGSHFGLLKRKCTSIG